MWHHVRIELASCRIYIQMTCPASGPCCIVVYVQNHYHVIFHSLVHLISLFSIMVLVCMVNISLRQHS
jgi:hypothetical protein